MEIEKEKGDDKNKEKPKRPLKYKKYTSDEKRELLKLAINPKQNPEKIDKLKGIGPTNIKRWQSQFSKAPSNFGQGMRKLNGRKVLYPELDAHLKGWFTKLREAKAAVSNQMMLLEAQSYVLLHNLQDIKLSKGWLGKVLKKLKIVQRRATKIAQKAATLFEPEIEKFVATIIEHR